MTIEKCPFPSCGGECKSQWRVGVFSVQCMACAYKSCSYLTESEAVSAHNLVSRSAEHLWIAVEALENIRNKYTGCEASTTGIGSCFRSGRTIGAEYGADQVCDACIAHAALARIKGLADTTKGENNAE